MFNLSLHKRALKIYDKFNSKAVARVNNALKNITENPFDHPHTKKLKGEFEGSYRYRLGGLRIVYSVNPEINPIFVEAIGARGDVYKG